MLIVSGEPMQREVFILATGKSFLAWDVRFGPPQQHVQSGPATQHEDDGSTQNGKAYVTVETAEVEFCACRGSLDVGQSGQLSSTGDEFFGVTILTVQAAGDHDLITGRASRHIGIRFEWDR
jgi:hypothetical protein